jgi:ABC-type transport system involved in multi-copper enzyme maturation permease subunit
MLGRICAIALNTFREAIRNRILYLLLIFALCMIAFAQILSLLTVGSQEKIIKDFGLGTIEVFSVLTAVLLGITLVSREIERRTVLTLIAKPIHRAEFILGKYGGLALTLLVNTAFMTIWFFAILAVKQMFDPRLGTAIVLLFLQFLLITAIAIFFSCVSSPILSCILTLALYGIGHLLWSLELLEARLGSQPARLLCRAVYYLLPNLGNFDIKGQVVHGIAVEPGAILHAFLYLALYGSAVLLGACAVFHRRELQ